MDTRTGMSLSSWKSHEREVVQVKFTTKKYEIEKMQFIAIISGKWLDLAIRFATFDKHFPLSKCLSLVSRRWQSEIYLPWCVRTGSLL